MAKTDAEEGIDGVEKALDVLWSPSDACHKSTVVMGILATVESVFANNLAEIPLACFFLPPADCQDGLRK